MGREAPEKGGQSCPHHIDIKTNEMSLSQGRRGLPGGRGHSTKCPETALDRIKDKQEQWVAVDGPLEVGDEEEVTFSSRLGQYHSKKGWGREDFLRGRGVHIFIGERRYQDRGGMLGREGVTDGGEAMGMHRTPGGLASGANAPLSAGMAGRGCP